MQTEKISAEVEKQLLLIYLVNKVKDILLYITVFILIYIMEMQMQ